MHVDGESPSLVVEGGLAAKAWRSLVRNRPVDRFDRRRLIIAAGATAIGSVLPLSPVHAQAEPTTIAPVAGLGQAPHGGGFFFVACGFSLASDGSALLTAAKFGS